MAKIIELDSHVADLIAAGEVVERPASVVKELVENSIDAGAGIITVEINAGGMTYIRVTDNGCGIAPEDVKTAFKRHATSKLRGAEGLEAIGTLGFRGEALAAIAAVSRIGLLTREAGAAEGLSLSLEAGQVVDISPAGCPEGTTIIVSDLFFNTPARQKFMKSDRAESSAIASTVLRCALSHPEVSIRFIRDGKQEYHTPGDSRVDSCIYNLFGREFSAGLLAANSSDEFITVTGFVSSPAAARGNRSYQFFFVNGRSIKSLTLQAALEQAFANTLPSGRFPSCVLYITIGLGNVDVNVHPAKTEVKFVSDKQVFDGVYYAALGAVESQRSKTPEQHVDTDKSKSTVWAQKSPGTGAPGAEYSADSGSRFKTMQVDEFRSKYASDNSKSSNPAEQTSPGYPAPGLTPDKSNSIPKFPAPTGFPASLEFPAPTELPVIPDSGFDKAPVRVIGEALNTYIIVEYQNGVWFIDKHAAHERIHFDALRSSGFEPMSQALITPVICRQGHEGVSLLLENGELLEKLGFSVESFGDDSVAVRRIPDEIDIEDAEHVLSEIIAELSHGYAPESARHDNILKSIACKAAIKAGKSSDKRELEALVARVMSGEINECPHGRPVAFEITKATLDKGFKRI